MGLVIQSEWGMCKKITRRKGKEGDRGGGHTNQRSKYFK